jgi:hypothetical protein
MILLKEAFPSPSGLSAKKEEPFYRRQAIPIPAFGINKKRTHILRFTKRRYHPIIKEFLFARDGEKSQDHGFPYPSRLGFLVPYEIKTGTLQRIDEY